MRFQRIGPAALGWTALALAAACTPAPVKAFEAFYAATAAKDVTEFRHQLCPKAQGLMAPFTDEAIAVDLQSMRVVKRIALVSEDPVKHVAVLDVEDAVGNHESIEMFFIDGRWCVDMKPPVEPVAGQP